MPVYKKKPSKVVKCCAGTSFGSSGATGVACLRSCKSFPCVWQRQSLEAPGYSGKLESTLAHAWTYSTALGGRSGVKVLIRFIFISLSCSVFLNNKCN